MALSYDVLPANGVDTQFNLTINYLDQSHISVFIDGVEDASFTWVNATRIETSTTPANGVNVKISRETPRSGADRLVDWEGNGTITESNLDTADLQLLYIAQEAFDALTDVLGPHSDAINWDVENKQLKNLNNGTETTDAVTLGQLQSATSGGGASISIPTPTGGDVGKLLTAITGGYELSTSSLGTVSSLDSIDTANLEDDAVTTVKIIDDAVTRDKIVDGAINGDKLSNDTITLAKLSHNSSANELMGYNSGTPSHIAVGSGLSLTGGTLSSTAVGTTITDFTSSLQPISQGTTLSPIAHGLGARPKRVRLSIVCNSDDGVFTTGDEYDISNEGAQLALGSSNYYGCTIKFDATNITIQYGNNPNVFQLMNSSGNPVGLTNSKWDLKAEASVW